MNRFFNDVKEMMSVWWVRIWATLPLIAGIIATVFFWVVMAPLFGVIVLVGTVLYEIIYLGVLYLLLHARD